jgi:integrase
MADIDDRWHRKGPDGPERTQRYGVGKRWRVRYRDPAGVQRAKSFQRKKDAEAYAESVGTDMRTGSYVDPAAGKITVGQWADQYVAALGHLTESSRSRTVGVVDHHIRPRWATTALSSVTHAAVLRWVSDLTATLSARSVRKVHGTFRQMLTLAVRDGRLNRNPADDVRLPRPGITEHRYLTHTEVTMLAKECGDYGLLVRFLAYTGLRWGEVSALHVRRVDLDRRRVQIVEAVTEVSGRLVWGSTKTHARRTVPLPRFLARDLTPWMEGRRGDDLLFPATEGGVLRVRNFRRDTFDPAVRKIGPAGFHPHELRHTAASLAIASGADVKVVQQMLGHKTATLTLDLYGHLFPDRLAELADRFDDAVCGPDVDPDPTPDGGEADQ